MIFLSAEWRNLVVVNYIVAPETLKPLLPAGTELDLWEGNCFISLVAFQFLNTRVLGRPIAGHRDFVEVNLRFYVTRQNGKELRRGVVFIRELVPKPAIALVARTCYGENYYAAPMKAQVDATQVTYEWQYAGRRSRISAKRAVKTEAPGAFESFILEHYWGYTKTRRETREYRVEHPPWRIHEIVSSEVDFKDPLLPGDPHSILLAEGSPVSVAFGTRV